MGLFKAVGRAWGALWQEHTAQQVELRAKPGQALAPVQFAYAPVPDLDYALVAYAMNAWVATAVNRMAEIAMTGEIRIVQRKDQTKSKDDHPLLDFIGQHGQPNDAQDSLEFLESHFQMFDIFGNAYWLWVGGRDGAPTELHLLDPQRVRVVPGRNRMIGGYEYTYMGQVFSLAPEEVTHFKRANPFADGVYYGMSSTQMLRQEINGDLSMSQWNNEVFSTGAPSGIMVVDESATDAQMAQMERDLEAKHGERRRVAVIRAKQGAAVWNEAALKPKDYDFRQGRLLSRQAVYDMLGLHVGLLSEASTEAHARVARDLVLNSVWLRHIRTASRLNNVLNFWPGWDRYRVQFVDMRGMDWNQMAMKIAALSGNRPIMSVDEIRAREFGLPPLPREDMQDGMDSTEDMGNRGAGDSDPDERAREGQFSSVEDATSGADDV